MNWIKRIAAVSVAASLTSGCAMYSLEDLRQTTPGGTSFQQELAKLYMDFAAEDEKGYDWFNSWYFADKGLRSAYGKDVPPEDVKNWNIPGDALPSLQRAHGELMVALTPENKQAHPTSAAQAQFYFDCWVQRQDEQWQTDRIDYCRQGFATAMEELNGTPRPAAAPAAEAAKPSTHKTHTKPKAEVAPAQEEPAAETNASAAAAPAEPAAKSGEVETMSYVVFFAGERPAITDPGEQVLDDVIKSLKGTEGYEIVLKSGTGSDPHSALFNQRAEAVTQRLVAGGVKAEAISMVDEGKAKAARHIEIFLSQ